MQEIAPKSIQLANDDIETVGQLIQIFNISEESQQIGVDCIEYVFHGSIY